MSVAKNPKPRKKTDEKVQIFCHEAQNVGSKHKDVAEESLPKQTSSSKERLNNNISNTKKKEFVIPRKKKQAKELLQSHRFDSRETKELLRSVQLSLRDPTFWSSYKFEKVEFVNNDKLARKYGEKRQALRHETPRNLEDKLAFLFTTSRTEVKSICEHGLHTGNTSLTSLGDPKLGIYVCRFADVISKRPLTTEDAGYLLVFRVVKGKVRFIGGSNPELQPTPHHDCHVSKSLTTLSSKASHSDVFESSQLYFYEIDENSDDFHVKYPRQVLPYAVLTFSILKSERQQTKIDDKYEGKKAVVTGYDFPSSADENILSSPNRIESKDDIISNANVSWSGVLAINKKQFAYVDFLSYSRKKHPLPINVDHFNISHKVSHDDLRKLLKCPVFRNGKPASSGVCIELNHGRKFLYYEVRIVNQIQEKFDEVVSHFVETKMAGVIENQCFKGPVYLYLIPTSKLTNDIGITDKKSPLALHVLVQVRHVRRLPNPQVLNEQEQDAGVDDTLLNEAIINSQVQEIFKKKYENKQEKLDGKTKQDKLTPLLSRRTSVEDGNNTMKDKPKSLEGRRWSTDAKLTLLPDGASHEKRMQYQKDAQKWVDDHLSSVVKEGDSNLERQESTSSSITPMRKSRFKWIRPKSLGKQSEPPEVVSSNDISMKTSGNEKENVPSKTTSYTDQGMDVEQGLSAQPIQDIQVSGASSLQSENKKVEIDFSSVQKLIKEFQHFDKQGKSTVGTRSSGLVDPRLQRRTSSSSSQDNNPDKVCPLPTLPPLVPPPIPPPPPPPISPFLSTPPPPSSAVGNIPVSKTTISRLSSATNVQLVTSPVSPPAVKRQEMLIPGLEPTGSPVFQLMREKVSFMNRSICTSASYLKDNLISTQSVTAWNQMHPRSPIAVSSSDSTPTRTAITTVSISNNKSYTTGSENRDHDQEVQTRPSYTREDSPKVPLSPPAINSFDSLDKCAAKSDFLDSDIPEIRPVYDVVINRPLTEAEKNSSRAIQNIKKILLQNRDVLKNTSSEDDNNNDVHRTDYRSGISMTHEEEMGKDLKQTGEDKILPMENRIQADHGSRKPKEYSKKENIVKEYGVRGRSSLIEDRNAIEKDGRNVDGRNGCLKQPVKNLVVDKKKSVGTTDKRSLMLDSASSSPHTPELRNGLELLDNLISCQNSSKSEPQMHRSESRGSNNSGRRSKSRSRETTPRKEKFDEERKKILPSRKRKVTIKRNNVKVNEWDDMTSDISDTELPLDSDEYITENDKKNDGHRVNKSSSRSKDFSRPSSHDGLESTHHYDKCSKERTPTRRTVSVGTKRDSHIDTRRGYRDDDWNRECKRRKLDQEQAEEILDLSLHDNESTHSDSAMSISSLDSVSFEYAVPNEESPNNKYRLVRTSSINGSSLKVTITRDIECHDTFPSHTNSDDVATDPYHTHLIPPSSPIEVDMTASSVMPASPGTPETAVPREDFLHTNIGYWSSGCMTKEGADILPHDIDDKCFEPIQQETIEDSTYSNGRGTWSAPSPPYQECGDDRDVRPAHYEHEEPLVKKSRGEGRCSTYYCQRSCSSSGASTGYDYDNTSYKDRNQLPNPDCYRPMDHDGHSLRVSNHSAPYTDDNYDNFKDLSDVYPDRYSHTSDIYDGQGDHGLFYASRSPYEDSSPCSIDCVEELGSNERYYTSDRTDSYSTSDRHGSPLYIGERYSQFLSDQRGFFSDEYEQRLLTNDDQPYDFPEQREINDDDDYRQRGTSSNDDRPPQYSPERSELINDRFRQRSPLAKHSRTLQYSPNRTTDDGYMRGSCSPLISNDRHSHYATSRRGVSGDGNGKRSLGNGERRSYSPDGRGISDEKYGQGLPLAINERCSPYSPDRRGVTDDSYVRRSPLESNGRHSKYSPDLRGITDDSYVRRSPLESNGRHSKYSPDLRGITEDGYGQRSSLEKNERRSKYSPDRRGVTEDGYGQRSSLQNNERRSQYSPDRRGITEDGYGHRSSLENNERHSQYSPDRRGVTDDSYGQRTSPENNKRHSQYSGDRRGARLPPKSGDRQSLYSKYQRGVLADDEFVQRSPLPNGIDDHSSCCSPERTTTGDDEYGEYYKASGNDIEYRQDYPNNQEFPLGIKEEKDLQFQADVYQGEEQQAYFSEDEGDGIEHQHSYAFDNVGPSYGSDGEMFEHDSVDTPEYYDKEKHKYLEDIVENNISMTTLALDHAVFEGIRDFPVQLLELAKYFVTNTSSDEEMAFNADSTESNVNSLAVSRDPRLNKGSKSGSGTDANTHEKETSYKVTTGGDSNTDRNGTESRRKKKLGDHRRVVKPFPKKQSCFYVYNPDNDSECEAVKHYMIKTGAQFLDVSNESNLNNMTGELRVLVCRKHRQAIHRISNLIKMKLRATVKFALFNNVEDVSKKTKAYAAIFQYGGVLIPDDTILRNVDPAVLEALLGFMAEQNDIHQKFFWVMNIRYIAYKKLGSQRPLTWRDAYVLDLLRKYRNERFVNIINKDYVLENVSPVQRYLDTALKQQLELMPTHRHFIVLSDLNKQTIEVSWFLNRGIGFMDVKDWLHMFAGEAKTRQLLSTSKYTKDGSEYAVEGTRQDILQYDTIDSPEDNESNEPSSVPTTPTEYLNPSQEGHHQHSHFSRSLSCDMVSRCSNYNDKSNMKEKRLEILSSINNVKTNLINKMGAIEGNTKANEECLGVQSNVAKQRQYERSRSYEPRLRIHNERVMQRWTDNHRTCDTTKTLAKNGLPDFKEAQKCTSYHGNERHTDSNYKETIPSSKLEKNTIKVESMKSLGSSYCQHRKSPVNGRSPLNTDHRAH